MIVYKFSSFEYLPGISGSDEPFFSSVKRLNCGGQKTGVYEIKIPKIISQLVMPFTKIKDPLIAFIPHFQGRFDLESRSQVCPGGIAVQTNLGGVAAVPDLGFAVVIKCLAEASEVKVQ